MSWKHEYLERAQHIIAVRASASQINTAMLLEDKLADDIQGKLAIWQCVDLLDWLQDMPYSQASGLLMDMLPLDVADYMSE
jgi:hypothetical protein